MSLGDPLPVEVSRLLAAAAAAVGDGTLARDRLDRAHAAVVPGMARPPALRRSAGFPLEPSWVSRDAPQALGA